MYQHDEDPLISTFLNKLRSFLKRLYKRNETDHCKPWRYFIACFTGITLTSPEDLSQQTMLMLSVNVIRCLPGFIRTVKKASVFRVPQQKFANSSVSASHSNMDGSVSTLAKNKSRVSSVVCESDTLHCCSRKYIVTCGSTGLGGYITQFSAILLTQTSLKIDWNH